MSVRLHDSKSLDIFNNKWDTLSTELESLKEKNSEPSTKEKKEYEKIILDFCKEKKRKVYGGFAQNELIKKINPKDAFYDDSNIKDIDIYSPEPIEDLMGLANLFMEKGYKNIVATEALHVETYKLFVEFEGVLDVSYVPNNIYHRMPFTEIDGIYYVSIHFSMIDMFRILTDPYGSGELRWPKFERTVLLQKYSPFKKIDKPLDKIKKHEVHEDILEDIKSFIDDNNESLILFGEYCFNYYVQYAKSNIKPVPLSTYQIISTNYAIDSNKIANILNNKYDIEIIEYYPFWSYIDYSFDVRYKDTVVLTMCGYNNRCTPVKTIDKINIGAYDINIMMCMMYQFKARVNKVEVDMEYYSAMLSQLIEIRNTYFKDNNKNMLDNTIFEEFITTCIGKSHNLMREDKLKKGLKAKKGGPIVWSYRPEREGIKDPTSKFVFLNSSGNPINNTKNLNIELTEKQNSSPKSKVSSSREKIDDEII